MIALSIRTGIAPSVWLAEPAEYINTALLLLAQEDEQNNQGS